ncbi:E3 ubiquitin-protein ligase arih2 [Podila epigama]|nr:E3 ubiquitin-protein ligase arih2 [Podila epigama]
MPQTSETTDNTSFHKATKESSLILTSSGTPAAAGTDVGHSQSPHRPELTTPSPSKQSLQLAWAPSKEVVFSATPSSLPLPLSPSVPRSSPTPTITVPLTTSHFLQAAPSSTHLSELHVPGSKTEPTLTRAHSLTTVAAPLAPSPIPIPSRKPPSFVALRQAFFRGQRYTPLHFLVITPFQLCHGPSHIHERCVLPHFGPTLDSLRAISFQSLLVAFSLPFLCVFTPGLVLPISLFQIFTLLAANSPGPHLNNQLKQGNLKRMASSSSSSAARHQNRMAVDSSPGSSNRTGHHHRRHSLADTQSLQATHHHQQHHQPPLSQIAAHYDYDQDDNDQSDTSEGDPGYEDVEYVKEVVSNSWGLNVTVIKCPVCQDVLPFAEWCKYVDQATRDQYQLYNQPYRSFSRFCDECEHEVFISKVKKDLVGASPKEMTPFFESLASDLEQIIRIGGFHLEDTASPTSSPSSTSYRVSEHVLEEKNALARTLVKTFTEDYQSLCAVTHNDLPRLTSMAQSYLSNLSFRTLVSSSQQHQVQPSPNDTRLNQGQEMTLQSRGHSNTIVAPPLVSRPTANGGHIQDNPPRTAGSIQQRGRRTGTSGVLEIYRTVMDSLLNLFDLYLTVDAGSTSRRRTESSPAKANEGDSFETPDSNGGEHMHHTSGNPASSTSLVSDLTTAESDRTGSIPDHISQTTLKRPRPTIVRKVMTRYQSKRESAVKKAIIQFSKDLSSLETRAEQWKELQFLHVRWLRWDWCHNCQRELCFQCGQSSHHEGEDCFSYMRSLVADEKRSKDSRNKRVKTTKSGKSTAFNDQVNGKGKSRADKEMTTLEWKLHNTKPCPNCCILIQRDDGCNKVDCMLCGYRFCWVCREAWGVSCGFFKCGRQPADKDATISHVQEDESAAKGASDSPDDQVEALDVSTAMGTTAAATSLTDPSMEPNLGVAGSNLHPKAATASSEKPEIGVPNVFAIQKRSRV